MVRKFSVALLSFSMAFQPTSLSSQDADSGSEPIPNSNIEPRELTGSLGEPAADASDASAGEQSQALGEDGNPVAVPPLANLPVIDDALSAKINSGAQPGAQASQTVRVIVYLDYLPHAAVLEDALNLRKTEIDALEQDRQALMDVLAARRNTNAPTDAENYGAMFDLSVDDKQALRELGERNEALSATIKQETTAELKTLIDAYQEPVVQAIGGLGGNVEFTTIAGNMIIATLPLSAISQLANVPGVMRMVEDSIMEGHLTTADNSTMVDPTDASLIGLWDAGQDGGIYDPAVIDSGTDLTSPLLVDDATRTNWCSWYLVAANGSASFGDAFTCDDLQGHGTHVYGIVGSHGSAIYPNHLGMAKGVEKMVSLKAGWLNSSSGRASMFWSDKYNLVDRALFNTLGLSGPVPYADDVEGFNLSYGGDTTLDDTDGGRFWDSVVSSIADVAVTISAGNSGPNNVAFSDPAVSYNAIAVANFNDRNTTSRADDIINSTSTVGPTANNRRKPDIAAPGTSIASANHNWETETDWVNQTGTSMAAPMVLGVIMDLMDAGVLDEVSLKALLINTAQKNLSGMNIESDADGWDPAIGWGAMNAYAAYFHRSDILVDSVTPNGTAGDFQLYKGSMRDEGAAGEGRDRATMVWNRVATYNPAAAPTTYYSLVDLNLRLYQESNEFLIGGDFDFNDNVHQVRVGAGAGDTDVIINAYAWSSSFAHGGATQSFALATEDGFTRVDHPSTFQGVAIWPSSVEPSEIFDLTFWLRNDSEIASHDNVFNLELPAGWMLISGTDTQNVGSAQGGGGITAQVVYTLRAPPSPAAGAQTVTVKHSHNSYNEPYGDFNWNINLTVEVDNTPPNPSPMSFSTLPFNVSTSSISMTATFASDIHGPVEYYLDYVSSPSFGTGGTDSGWQASRSYTDLFLTANDEYCYRAWARDNAVGNNQTSPSATTCTYSSQATPAGVSFGTVANTAINVFASSTPNNLTLDSSGLLVRNTTAGTNSGWKQNNNLWSSVGLTPATGYTFNAQARNGDADLTSNSPSSVRYTLANIPAVDSLLTVSDSEIKVALNPNGNGSQAEYFIENTTAGTDSGWINSTSWDSDGLTCETFHDFQARARNGDGIETIIVPLGLQTTGACITDTDGDGVEDSSDNCTLVPNADQRDTNGDGYGNICDADLNNDGIVNVIDLGIFKGAFFLVGDLDEDFNGDNVVNAIDLGILKAAFFSPPGPSGLAP